VRRRDVVGLLALGLAVVFTTASCGTSVARAPDLAHGRELFRGGTDGKLSCGFCHTLEAAATVGPFAPNLDSEFAGDTSAEIRKEVLAQIQHPFCLDPNDPSRCMPKNIVTGGDAADVAAYVGRCSGNAGNRGCQPFPDRLRGEALRGERLDTRLGCISCHWTNGNVNVAPSFKGLFGSKVELADGTTVTADYIYLLESIQLPDQKIVKGFKPGVMSLRIEPGQVTPAQAKALIAYIKTLK
jgi:cytochrome c551/c552